MPEKNPFPDDIEEILDLYEQLYGPDRDKELDAYYENELRIGDRAHGPDREDE